MKNTIVIFYFVISCFISGCGSEGEVIEVENSDNRTIVTECHAPSNPYGDDGGHDAGFNWAEDTGRSCDGNSQSFNEGCEEYHRQLHQYEKC